MASCCSITAGSAGPERARIAPASASETPIRRASSPTFNNRSSASLCVTGYYSLTPRKGQEREEKMTF